MAMLVRFVVVFSLAWAVAANAVTIESNGGKVTGSGIWDIDPDVIWYEVIIEDPLQWA